MKVLEIKHIEDCFDGSFIKELLLDKDINRDLIDELSQDADLQYFPEFEKPFFRIDQKGQFIVKGIEGNRTIRVILKRDAKITLEIIRKRINAV